MSFSGFAFRLPVACHPPAVYASQWYLLSFTMQSFPLGLPLQWNTWFGVAAGFTQWYRRFQVQIPYYILVRCVAAAIEFGIQIFKIESMKFMRKVIQILPMLLVQLKREIHHTTTTTMKKYVESEQPYTNNMRKDIFHIVLTMESRIGNCEYRQMKSERKMNTNGAHSISKICSDEMLPILMISLMCREDMYIFSVFLRARIIWFAKVILKQCTFFHSFLVLLVFLDSFCVWL